MTNKARSGSCSKWLHALCAGFFVIVATGYLHDVLFQDKHLSAFDFILNKPAWQAERGPHLVNNGVLADSPTAHFPYRRIFWDNLREGKNTDYLPHILTGQPSNGQGTGAFATSFFQLFMDIPNALDWSTWFRLILAGIFMYTLMIWLGCHPIIAVLAGIAWTYNTHQLAWLLFPQHLAAQIWIPLIFLLNFKLIRDGPDWPSSLGLILSVVLFYSSGYTQIALYTFIFLGLFNTVYLWLAKETVRAKWQLWIIVHGLYLGTALLIFPDVMSQLAEIGDGLRSAQPFRYLSLGSVPLLDSLLSLPADGLPHSLDIVRFMFPHYLGLGLWAPGVREIYNTNAVEFMAFFGLIVFYLTLYGICGGLRRHSRLVWALGITLFFVFALFNSNPLIVGLVNLIPAGGAGQFDRFITLIIFACIVLSGIGLRYFLEDRKTHELIWAVVPGVLLLVWIGVAKLHYDPIVNLWSFIPPMAVLTSFVIVSHLLARKNMGNLVGLIAIGFTLYELLPATYAFNTRLDAKDHFPENSVISAIQKTPGDFRTAVIMSNVSYHHNIFSYYKLATIGGYATTVRNQYVKFLREAYEDVSITANGIVFLMHHRPEILRLLNTRFVVTDIPLAGDRVQERFTNEANTLYEITDPLDRVYCGTDQLVVSNTDEIPRRLAEAVTAYDRPIFVTTPLVDESQLTANCSISDLKVYQGKIEFHARADKPTLIFIATNHHENWRARIDGIRTGISAGNYAFMVVPVPAGSSEVQLEYTDEKLLLGAFLLIGFGFFVLGYAALATNPTWRKALFVLCALILIGKNAPSVPGLKNLEISEREVALELGPADSNRS